MIVEDTPGAVSNTDWFSSYGFCLPKNDFDIALQFVLSAFSKSGKGVQVTELLFNLLLVYKCSFRSALAFLECTRGIFRVLQ